MMSNPLRILDSKDPKIKNIIDDVPILKSIYPAKLKINLKFF